ncbi:MAG: HTTM domain-containing protein, partial [Bacteroidota bacterium]|nr:HTTM domain-containing protein [Bacteroidota bacterium]
MSLIYSIRSQMAAPAPAGSLAFFRIVFGIMMFAGIIRFMLNGWVTELYVSPQYLFPYYGFEWAQVRLPEFGLYAVFTGMVILSLLIALGLFYRLSIILFFIAFSYVELLDKATYLNHYYFISMLSFLMIFLPMNRQYSLDAWRVKNFSRAFVPQWTVWALMLQVGLVYFFGGIAKIKPDWLLEAQPLRIWFSNSTEFPVIGTMMDDAWVAYFISWLAMIFDLTVPFLLLIGRTRIIAFAFIIAFHVLTAHLFFIGMFPYIMMAAALIFFPASFHRKYLELLHSLLF